ncbi:MAG: DUF5979 domain-containing protein [Collinsella sp.]
MNRDIYSQAEQLNKKHRRKRTWYKILSVPICLVVFVTTYALILPAITMESTPDTSCGIAEHVHTDDCYELPGTPAHKEIQSTAGEDVPTDAAQGGNVPGDAVQSTDAANGDTPEDDAAVNSSPARAPAASGSITDVTLTIKDNVSTSGCYEAVVTGGDPALEGKNVQYQWYKSTDGGATYTAVKAKNFTAGDNTVSNISGDHGEKLFLALDGGTVSDTLPSVTYKAVLKVDGAEYDSVSAALTNTTYQASVLNGSFEAPDLTNYPYQEFVPEGTAGLFWKTTASNEENGMPIYPDGLTQQNDGKHYIEIIDTGTDEHKNQAVGYHKQGTPADGKQYAEINAGAAGALYQTIATIPGTTMYWSVDHNGRDGTDTMAVVMMPESIAKNITTQAELRKVLDNPGDFGATVASDLSAPQGKWITHSGQYTIPEGQYETRFFFMAVSTYNNNDYIGNHIDNVWFSQQIPPASPKEPHFTLTKHVVGPLTKDDLQLLSERLIFTVQKSANSSFTNPETVNKYFAKNLGSWTPNEDGSWTLSARISMKDQEIGAYYRIVESGAELDGFNLTVTDTNDAVRLQSTTVVDFTFTNTYTDAGRALTLKKIVNAPDTTGSFTFTVSYTDAGGEAQTKSVTLKNGDSTTITDIPKDAQVTVTETNTDGYTVTMKDPSTGTVLAGSSSYTFAMNDDTAVDIYNTSSVALPETGGIGRGIFLFAGIGLMLTAVIAGCLLRRKYGKGGD